MKGKVNKKLSSEENIKEVMKDSGKTQKITQW